jgi:hypothetical protein
MTVRRRTANWIGKRFGATGIYIREAREVRPYTSTSSQPWQCSSKNCRNDAKFKSEDGTLFYCEICAKNELKSNADEAAAALLRLIDAERYRPQKVLPGSFEAE